MSNDNPNPAKPKFFLFRWIRTFTKSFTTARDTPFNFYCQEHNVYHGTGGRKRYSDYHIYR